MKLYATLFGLLFSGLFTASLASQASPFVGIGASLDSRDSLIRELVNGTANESTETTLDRVVNVNLDALAREGKPELAASLRKEWQREFANGSLRRLSDLGDHAPLSKFLTKLLVILSATIGDKPEYAQILLDLKTLNYAIPVVFSPRGDWRQGKNPRSDRAEYREHFVPFSGVVTYYTTLGACRAMAAAKGLDVLGKRLCPRIAALLEKEMQARLAPKLSDYVFNRANGIDTLLNLASRDFYYTDEESLQAALSRN